MLFISRHHKYQTFPVKNIVLFLMLTFFSACSHFDGKEEPLTPTQAVHQIHPAFPQPNILKEGGMTQNSSLWRSGPKSLFGDRRARDTGDIVTIVIEIDEEAEMQNSSAGTRASSEAFSLSALFGLPQRLQDDLPDGASLTPAVDLSRDRSQSGNGSISRQEKITLRLAATVVGTLPNGYMVIAGTQKIRVNHETRDLQVGGVIRPVDISRLNTINYDKIADARIVYGGHGQVSTMVKPKVGSGILDAILPF